MIAISSLLVPTNTKDLSGQYAKAVASVAPVAITERHNLVSASQILKNPSLPVESTKLTTLPLKTMLANSTCVTALLCADFLDDGGGTWCCVLRKAGPRGLCGRLSLLRLNGFGLRLRLARLQWICAARG